MKKNAVNKSGFTLIELLIVVLIIGILSATALPGYRKAVERSRVSDALTTMQAVAKSEHGWYLTNNSYTKDFANLDIEINGTMNEGALETDFYTYELLDTGILAGRNNREYSIYQDYETKQIMCTPGSHYICENLGAFTKEPCEKVGMAWANTNSTCYVDEEERCLGLYADELGEGIWKGSYCGYYETNERILNEGMECKAYHWYSCGYSTINSGGICRGEQNSCQNSTINNGGVCLGTKSNDCINSIVNDGGVCEGRGQNNCAYSTINAGGVCVGKAGMACSNSVINKGGKCTGSGGGICRYSDINGGVCESEDGCAFVRVHNNGVCSGECWGSTIYDGGICKSSATNRCKNITGSEPTVYSGTGCCCGDYCGSAPKCDQARCDALD